MKSKIQKISLKRRSLKLTKTKNINKHKINKMKENKKIQENKKFNISTVKNIDTKKEQKILLINLSEMIQKKINSQKIQKIQKENFDKNSNFLENLEFIRKNNNNFYNFDEILDNILTNTLYLKIINCFLEKINVFPELKNYHSEIFDIFMTFKFKEILNIKIFDILLCSNKLRKVLFYINNFSQEFQEIINFPFRTFVKKYMNYEFSQRFYDNNNFLNSLGQNRNFYLENHFIMENIFLGKILEGAEY